METVPGDRVRAAATFRLRPRTRRSVPPRGALRNRPILAEDLCAVDARGRVIARKGENVCRVPYGPERITRDRSPKIRVGLRSFDSRLIYRRPRRGRTDGAVVTDPRRHSPYAYGRVSNQLSVPDPFGSQNYLEGIVAARVPSR